MRRSFCQVFQEAKGGLAGAQENRGSHTARSGQEPHSRRDQVSKFLVGHSQSASTLSLVLRQCRQAMVVVLTIVTTGLPKCSHDQHSVLEYIAQRQVCAQHRHSVVESLRLCQECAAPALVVEYIAAVQNCAQQ